MLSWNNVKPTGSVSDTVYAMNSSQEKVRTLVNHYKLESETPIRLLDLSTELGEMTKEYLLLTNYGRQSFQANEHWKTELGDIYFSLLCLADATGVELESSLEKVLEKYRQRFGDSGQIGSV